ncbi:ATP-binding protein [Propioniciclava soli]|uniref:ATP-binding protein n=1 Tax=Propioniciclava soli TaxID=2775081 RepID=UPI001E3CC70C
MTRPEFVAPGEPRRLDRPLDRAWLGGVAAGLADQTGLPVLAVRILFVVVGAWRLVGVGVYLGLWLALPPAEPDANAPGVDAATRQNLRTVAARRPRTTDVGQAVALGVIGVGLVWLIQWLGWGLAWDWWAAAVAAAVGLTLVWWQADHAGPGRSDASPDWRGLLGPLVAHWTTVVCLGVGLGLLGVAVLLTWWAVPDLGAFWGTALAVGAAVVAVVAAAAPWAVRTRRAFVRAREAKLLSDARADMAAHLHDSVLQTLALIQRQAHHPREVVRLARRQERQLRQWLYGASSSAQTLRDALHEAAQAIEDDFDVTVECVTVGDVALTARLEQLVRAAREAIVNAAKHSGAPVVDVYAEVDEDSVEVFVRDRGRGFDVDLVAEDRMGVRGSILERMARHHGVARIRSDAERGTEVSLEMRL